MDVTAGAVTTGAALVTRVTVAVAAVARSVISPSKSNVLGTTATTAALLGKLTKIMTPGLGYCTVLVGVIQLNS